AQRRRPPAFAERGGAAGSVPANPRLVTGTRGRPGALGRPLPFRRGEPLARTGENPWFCPGPLSLRVVARVRRPRSRRAHSGSRRLHPPLAEEMQPSGVAALSPAPLREGGRFGSEGRGPRETRGFPALDGAADLVVERDDGDAEG